MNNGFMSKAAAGLGSGMAIAGQMGYQAKLQGDLEAQKAEIMAKRDAMLQTGENTRAAAHDQTQRDIADKQVAGHLSGIMMTNQVKDTKPIILPKGGKLFGADGSLLAENTEASDKAIILPEGAKAFGPDGKELASNPKAAEDKGLPKTDKDIDQRVNDLRSTITARMGNGFMEKLTEPDRKDFDTLFTKASKMIRNKLTMEDAYASVVDDLERLKAKVTPADSKPSSAVDSIRNKFKY